MIKIKQRKKDVTSFFLGRRDNEHHTPNNNTLPTKPSNQKEHEKKLGAALPFLLKKDDRTQKRLSQRSRKDSVEFQIREILSKKHEEATLMKPKMSKLRAANGKKIAYVAKLNAEIAMLQTRRKSFNNSDNNSPTSIIENSCNGKNDLSSTDTATLENSVKNGDCVETDKKEKHKIIHQLICICTEKEMCCKKLDETVSVRDSAILDLENIVCFQEESILSLVRYITNPIKCNFEEKYLSLSLGKDMDVIKKSMTTSIDEINDIDKESDKFTWIYAYAHARNKLIRSNSVKIIKEVKIVYTSEINNNTSTASINTTTKLKKYIQWITKLELHLFDQITNFSIELDSFYVVTINANFFIHVATQFHTLIQDTTDVLELIRTIYPNCVQQEKNNNISTNLLETAITTIEVIFSMKDLVAASLQSMKAWLALVLESFSKDDVFFESFKSTQQDLRKSIFEKKETIASLSSPNMNVILTQDAIRIILRCKLEEKDLEINHLNAECEELNATIHKLSVLCHLRKSDTDKSLILK